MTTPLQVRWRRLIAELTTAASPWAAQSTLTHVIKLMEALLALDDGALARWAELIAARIADDHRIMICGEPLSQPLAEHLTALLNPEPIRWPARRIVVRALRTGSPAQLVSRPHEDGTLAGQVRRYGNVGDVLLVLCTAQDEALVRAVEEARHLGVTTLAITGGDDAFAGHVDDRLAISAESDQNLREVQLLAGHLLAAATTEALAQEPPEEQAPPVLSVIGAPRKPAQDVARREPVPLVVIGDVLLDDEITGSVNRVSPEAAAVVVSQPTHEFSVGGAGLAAALAADNGQEVVLITALGEDNEALIALDLLAEAGVTTINLGTSARTPVKTRVRASGQTLLMLDYANPPGAVGALTDEARDAIASASAVLVSDYGRGVAAAEDVRAELARVVMRTPTVWDPHPRGPAPVAGVCMVTPNSGEAAHFAPGGNESGLLGDVDRARRLRRSWEVDHVVVTRGGEGAVLVNDDIAPPLAIPAPTTVLGGDTKGAGDSFAVALACQLSAAAKPSVALHHAVAVAGQFVAGGGRTRKPEQPTVTDAFTLAETVRASGGTVVATGGCFDLLHPGHVALLRRARELGDCLIVCLNSDASVARLKGPQRPLIGQEERAKVLTALSYVDAVVVFDEDTPAKVLAKLRPRIFVKGGDYLKVDLPERSVIEKAGGAIVLVPFLEGHSTTSLIERAITRNGEPSKHA